MADFLDATVTVPGHVVFRAFPAEVVVLNLETGKYHGLNRTAGRMLELLQAEHSVRAVAAQLAEEFGQPFERVASDVNALCERLVARGLVNVDAKGG